MESHALPRTAVEARARGALRYLTNVPCKHGHVSERRTSDNRCLGCEPERTAGRAPKRKAQRDANPAAHRIRNARWKRQNPEKRRANQRDLQRRHPERARGYTRKWAAANRPHVAAYGKRYATENPEKFAAWAAKRRADLLRATPPWADIEKIEAKYADAARRTRETGVPHVVDHEWPLRGRDGSRGLHVDYNLRVITESENARKHNRAPT